MSDIANNAEKHALRQQRNATADEVASLFGQLEEARAKIKELEAKIPLEVPEQSK